MIADSAVADASIDRKYQYNYHNLTSLSRHEKGEVGLCFCRLLCIFSMQFLSDM